MSTAIIKNEPSSLQQVEREKLEIRVALNSNLHGMPDEQVWAYYRWMAERVDVDPMSHPFDIITTTPRNGSPIKKLYPNSNLTAQLGEKRGYSYSEMRIGINKELVDLGFKVAHVAVTVTAPDGRSLVSEAFVDLMSGWEGKALAGENLVNALKKAGTQCRRRGTLQMAGLALPSDEIPTVKLGAIERAEGDVDAVVIEHPPAAALSAARIATVTPESLDSEEFTEEERAIYQSAIEDEGVEIGATQEEFWEFVRGHQISSKDAAPFAKQAAKGEITWDNAIATLARK